MKREEIINKYFLDIKLDIAYVDLYSVRKGIFDAIKQYSPKFSGVLLDVGCGIMPYREFILESNSRVTKYIGLDFKDSLEVEYFLGKPDLFWNGEIIPLEDNCIDTILATELFEHCKYPESIMREMIRVLKPGGILFFTVPFVWNLHVIPFDEYRYTPFSLKRHLNSAGFNNIELMALGGWDASLAQMISIWFKNRPLKNIYKRLLNKIVLFSIEKLLYRDRIFDKFNFEKEGVMISGISGIAYKT